MSKLSEERGPAISGSSLLIHFGMLCAYALNNPIGNRIAFIISTSWLGFKLVSDPQFSRRFRSKVEIPLLGAIIFGCKAIAYLVQGDVKTEVILRECVMIGVGCVSWASILATSLYSLSSIWNILLCFALVRTIESGVLALAVYLFPETFFGYQIAAIQWNLTVDEEQFQLNQANRLFGVFTVDSVNTGVYLCIAITIFVCYYTSCTASVIRRIVVSAAISICAVALLFTWSRSGWVTTAIAIAVRFLTLKNGLRRLFVSILFLVPFGFAFQDEIQSRLAVDERLAGNESVNMRLDTMAAYIDRIDLAGLFGIGVERESISNILRSTTTISSENWLLQAIFETGYIGGMAFLTLVIRSCAFLVEPLIVSRGIDGYTVKTVVSMLIVLGSFLLLASTCLITYENPIFWMLFGLSFSLGSVSKLGRYQSEQS